LCLKGTASKNQASFSAHLTLPLPLTISDLLFQVMGSGMRKERYMLIVTTEYISGKNIQTLGLVSGGTIQTVNAIRDIGSGLKNLVGGELKKYNQMMSDARSLAIERMIAEAQAMGADAIISVRFSTSSVMQSAAEVMVYGTAVKFI
jgi:uncharacterized protein YbjQ (UPF0145 family)